MPGRKEPVDPWAAPDPALALALQELDKYRRRRVRTRRVGRTVEVLLLVTTAATTLAAALHSVAWVTASLGAGSVIIAGLRNIFPYREYGAVYAASWARLRAEINEYRVLPEDRRDHDAQKVLIRKINEIVDSEVMERISRQQKGGRMISTSSAGYIAFTSR